MFCSVALKLTYVSDTLQHRLFTLHLYLLINRFLMIHALITDVLIIVELNALILILIQILIILIRLKADRFTAKRLTAQDFIVVRH